MADRGHLHHDGSRGGRDGAHHEVLLHGQGRREPEGVAGAGIRRRGQIPEAEPHLQIHCQG